MLLVYSVTSEIELAVCACVLLYRALYKRLISLARFWVSGNGWMTPGEASVIGACAFQQTNLSSSMSWLYV